MGEVSIDEMWEQYELTATPSNRVRLFEYYAPWSRRMAAILYNRYHHYLLQYEDYISIVSEALIGSIDNFNRARNIPFEAYCFSRMKGYVLNEINRLAKSDGNCTRPYNSKRKCVSVDRLDHPVESFEDVVEFTIHTALEMLLASDNREDEPYGYYSKNQLIKRIRTIVNMLTEKEKVVINTYYYQFMNYEQIGSLLNISKSRISQIHRSAISSIKEIYEQSYC